METLKINTQTEHKKTIGRFLFILFSAVFTSTLLLFYSFFLEDIVPESNLIREYCICFGQLFFQGILLFFLSSKQHLILEYLYQMMIVSFIGGMLLLPVIVSSAIFFPCKPGSYYYLFYFFLIVLFMFFDHKKRVKKINAPAWLTYTWVLYRLIILLIIL